MSQQQKRVLIPSVQGGPFNGRANRMIDIDIMADNSVDFSKSFIQFTTEITTVEDGVYNVGLRSAEDSDYQLYNVDLIKNCNLKSDKVGPLEDIRQVGFLNHTLNEYTKSSEQKVSEIASLHQMSYWDYNLLSPFAELRKEGSYASRMVQAHLKVPLSQLYSLGSVTEFPADKLGTVRIHLELDDVSVSRIQPVFINSISQMEASSIMPLVDLPTGGNTFVCAPAIPFRNLADSPLYVSMPITLNATELEAPVNTTITNISFDVTSGLLTFTTADSLEAIALTDVTVACQTPTGLTFQILTAELGLVNNKSPSSMSMLDYTTFTVEESTVNSAIWHKVYEVEQNAQNVMILFKDYLPYSAQDLIKFRIRVDNEDVIDRDVETSYGDAGVAGSLLKLRDGLYYDLLNKTFANAGIQINSFLEKSLSRRDRGLDGKFNDNESVLMLGSPVPLTETMKQYQLDLETSGGIMKTVILYKQVLKQINF
jgi:hypothetical protein